MQVLGRFVSLLLWIAAIAIAVLPAIVAADNGGVLPWTQWLMSCVAGVLLLLTLPTILGRGRVGSWQALSVTAGLVSFALLAAFQSVPLPGSFLAIVAPGTADSYAAVFDAVRLGMLESELNFVSPSHPVTLSAWLTLNTAALMVVLATLALVSSQLYVTRGRITVLLVAIAMTGAIQAAMGLYQFLNDPTATVWGVKSFYGGAPFGSFINRSSAAVMMNVGLGAGLGLVAWRLAAMTGSTLDGDVFPASELLDVVFDRVAMIGIACSLLCVGGLFACGSRGGMVGMIAGLLLAFGVVQSLHRGRGVIPTITAIALMAAVLLINFELPATSIDRLNATSDQVITEDGFQDGRLAHWKDGWRAAMAQPFTGWGLGAYRFAYLPFQQTSGGSWFVNADNLWLEWFVEGGVVGVVLVLLVLVFFIKALGRLNASAAPIDHGLATAGWFTLGSLATSQFFDFGLRIPANSAVVVVLSSAIVARASVIGYFEDDVRRRSPTAPAPSNGRRNPLAFLKISGSPTIVMLVTALVGVLMIPAIRQMDASARADKLSRLAKLLPRGEQFNASVAMDLEAQLATHLQRHPSDDTGWLERSRITIDLARYQAAQDALQSQTSELENWLYSYRTLAPSRLRTFWFDNGGRSAPIATDETDNGTHELEDLFQDALFVEEATEESSLDPEFADPTDRALTRDVTPLFPISATAAEASDSVLPSDADLRQNRQRIAFGSALHLGRAFAIDALLVCPLSDVAHLAVVRLDFAGGSPPQTEALLSSVIRLRSRNGQSLLAAGQLAAEAGLWKLAAESFFGAMQMEPHLTNAIVAIYPEASPVSLAGLLPSDPTVLAFAANQELKKAKPNVAILLRAIDSLNRSTSSERAVQVQRLQLLAAIHLKRNQPKLAAESFAKVMALVPGDIETRYRYAVALRQSGNIAESRQQARAGRQIAPQDPRFEELLRSMGEMVDR